MITGSATVVKGAAFELGGMICRDLVVEEGAVVHLHGMVLGNVTNNGGQLEIFGMIRGRLLKRSGTTHVDAKAVIAGGIH
ncbi:MAG TPA: hypothetical protein VN822_04255 [Candidatus Acidoferrales bacterium]|nr:hypothetical protein [Candidatus Acidoferrales bacterium]